MLRRFSYLSLGILVLVGARWEAVSRASGAFTDLAPLTVPQRAAADFDADGRADVAFIQAQGGSRVWVTLSGSPDAVTFETNAVSIVANDIDHDGDVDLVATTSSNQVVIWINDGRGHFTQEQERLPSSDLSLATTVVDSSSRDQPVASGPAAPQFVVHSRRNKAGVVATQIRRPTAPRGVTPSFLSLSSPRAPPFASNLN
jgi:hypothetical protein